MRDTRLSALWVRADIQPIAKPRNRRRAEVEADAHIGFQGLRDQELNEPGSNALPRLQTLWAVYTTGCLLKMTYSLSR
jgi:hypothetical protein